MQSEQIEKLEQVARFFAADWGQHGAGRYSYLLENTISRLKHREAAEREALLERALGGAVGSEA